MTSPIPSNCRCLPQLLAAGVVLAQEAGCCAFASVAPSDAAGSVNSAPRKDNEYVHLVAISLAHPLTGPGGESQGHDGERHPFADPASERPGLGEAKYRRGRAGQLELIEAGQVRHVQGLAPRTRSRPYGVAPRRGRRLHNRLARERFVGKRSSCGTSVGCPSWSANSMRRTASRNACSSRAISASEYGIGGRQAPQKRLVRLIIDRKTRRIGVAINRCNGAREGREMIELNHAEPRQASSTRAPAPVSAGNRAT